MKILLFILLFVSINPIFGQELDSIQLIKKLNDFEITDLQSSSEYRELLLSSGKWLSNEQLEFFFQKGIVTAKKMGLDSMIVAFAYPIYDFFNTKASNPEKALDYALIMMEASDGFIVPEDSFIVKGQLAGFVGTSYYKVGDYFSAIKFYTLAIENLPKSSFPEATVDPLNNIGRVYKEMGDYQNALKYYRLSESFAYMESSATRFYYLTSMYNNMTDVFLNNLNQQDSANVYRKKSLGIVDSIDTSVNLSAKAGILNTFLLSTDYFLKQEEWDSTQFYLNKAFPFKEYSIKDYQLIEFEYCLKSGKCKDLEGKYSELEENVNFDNPNEFNVKFLKIKIEYLNYKGKYQKASRISQELSNLEKELVNQERINYSLYVDGQFEKTKKEEQIKQLEIENKLKQTQSTFLIVGLILSLSLIGFILYIFRQAKQKNKLLEKDIQNNKLIEQQAAELEKSNQFKNRLFANISHEVRTPLTLINAAIGRLSKIDNLSKKDIKQLKIAQNNSQEVLSLTNQVLDLTKAETGVLKVNLFTFQFDEVVKFLTPQFQSLASNKSLKFEIKAPATNNKIELVTDTDKLITVLKNLVINAIKYTPTGGQVTWDYEVSPTTLICRISDTGQGISKDDLPNIFNRYFQSNNNRTQESGVGIGLAICKEYSELLGGSIKVESEVEKGSVFTLTAPLKLSAKTPETLAYFFPQRDVLKIWGKLPKQNFVTKDIDEDYILIVEDNIDLCHYYFDVLGVDYQLYFAHNGKEALRQIELKQPTLILTDWMMPGMDGKELITTLKQNKTTASIPILMVTAIAMQASKSSMLKIGVDDYLTKPFQEPELKAHVNYLLDMKNQRDLAHLEASLETLENSTKQDINAIDETLLKAMEQYVLKNIGKFNLNLEEISQELGISLRHLHRRSKSLSGLTPNQFITEVRFREAKKMLEEGIYSSVKAVTYSVGFKAEKNFSRNFKKRFGKYPSEFLRE